MDTLFWLLADNPGFGLIVVFVTLGGVAAFFIAIRDVTQKKHAIQHNFPVVGHLRYMLEEIGPELRQYFVAQDKEELPFNRSERAWVYASAKGQDNTFGFGTSEQIYSTGYPIIKHAAFPFPDSKAVVLMGDPSVLPCLKVIGEKHGRKRPYRPMSIVNVSAMSFGSLGQNAVRALNLGAKKAHSYHNTGEGGLSPHHLSAGADVVWQLGTGYFGARTAEGGFSLPTLVDKVQRYRQVRMIEVKLSQGAKPGKGGILPAAKVTAEIAEIRGVPRGHDCISPNHHQEFSDVDGLIDFVERVSDACGLPVGIKSAVGEIDFWKKLAERMLARQEGPDFITIDGGEGGTGAAPLTFADHVSLPFKVAFARVYQVFLEAGAADQVCWIGSGKLGFPDRTVVAVCMGCDMVNVAREAMLSIGCIQAQKCHTDRCPTGVATHDSFLQAGLDVDMKGQRAGKYLQTFRKELRSLAHAAGLEHPALFGPDHVEFSTGVNRFSSLGQVFGYTKQPVPFPGFENLRETP